jgi:hypothetical protein
MFLFCFVGILSPGPRHSAHKKRLSFSVFNGVRLIPGRPRSPALEQYNSDDIDDDVDDHIASEHDITSPIDCLNCNEDLPISLYEELECASSLDENACISSLPTSSSKLSSVLHAVFSPFTSNKNSLHKLSSPNGRANTNTNTNSHATVQRVLMEQN